MLMKANATWEDGARQELVLSYNAITANPPAAGYDAALIQGRYKVVTGHQGGSGFWTGPIHPNATGPADPDRNGTACGAFSCCQGCLYDIQVCPVVVVVVVVIVAVVLSLSVSVSVSLSGCGGGCTEICRAVNPLRF